MTRRSNRLVGNQIPNLVPLVVSGDSGVVRLGSGSTIGHSNFGSGPTMGRSN